MRLSFKYGSRNIEFDVIFRNRKTLEIGVEAPDIVIVVAPLNTTEAVIIDKVKTKAKWIVEKLYSFKDVEYRHINREFVNGESFMYLGRNYSLQIHEDLTVKVPDVKLKFGKFYITAKSKDETTIHKAMEKWFREKTEEKVTEKVKYYQQYFNEVPAGIRAKEQQKRWASCTSKNELLFNWRCVMSPSWVLDYIVVHEMCHMLYKNHSQEFWDKVASILPDYKRRKEWLKKNGIKMDL